MNSLIAKILTLLVCHVGGPGTAQQSQPVIQTFLRRIEASAGWKPRSSEGAYRTRLADCQAYIAEHKPNVIVVDLPTYLKKQKAWRLTPLAHMGSATKKQYFLLVREGGPKTLAALKGKVLITTLAKQPRFLSRVVFGKTIDVTKHFVLKRTRRSLRGIRKVSREQADATLVDEAAYAHLKELPLKRKLKAIYRSTTLPGLTLATTTGASATLKRALKRALKKVCSGEGKTLCRTFNVKTFSPAKAALYRKLTAAYQ